MTTTTPDAEGATRLPKRTVTFGWAIKRTLLAFFILLIVVGGAAWLLDASIDRSQDGEPAAGALSAQPAVVAKAGLGL